MVLRLVLDVVRRKWMTIVLALVQLYLFAKAVVLETWPSTDPLACLLSGAAFLTVFPGTTLLSRELYQLPISRRALWLARWWLSTAGAVLVAQPAMALAQWFGRSRGPSGEELILSTTLAFLYCGCVMAVVATRWGQSADKPLALQPASARAEPRAPVPPVNVTRLILRVAPRVMFRLVGVFGALMVPLVAPFLFARYLPHTFPAVHATSVMVMMAMAVMTAWGYAHRPAIEARPSLRIARTAVRGPNAARLARAPAGHAPAAVAAPTRFIDRLTGLRLPLWTMGRKYLITYASVIALGIAWWWFMSFYKAVPALSTVLSRADMLPLASRSAHVTEPITVGSLLLIAGMLDVGVLANIRPLRTLPLSATRLSCMPLGLGLVSATTLWIVFLALHVLVLGTLPVALRADLFIAFVALTALSHTLRVVLPGQPAVRSMMSLSPLMIIWLALGYSDSFRTDIVQPAMFVGGLLVLAASFALMHRALTRASRIYQPRPMPAPF